MRYFYVISCAQFTWVIFSCVCVSRLVAKEKEPITPFISKVRALFDTMKVSSVLVIGGCGDYFEVADTVIMMDCYAPKVGAGAGAGGGDGGDGGGDGGSDE